MRSKNQLDLGASSDAIKTRSPTLKFCSFWDHFLRINSKGRYSRTQRFQNMSDAAWTERHFFVKFISLLLNFPELKFDDEKQIKRWFGVSAPRSVISSCLPFKMGATSHKKVWQSPVKITFFMMAFKEGFTDLIRDSQIPPILGLTHGLKIHVISFWLKHLTILGWSNYQTHDFNSLLAPTKLVPLYDRITCTFPHLDMNVRRVSVNASVDKSLANSIWIALAVRHVNSTPYLFAESEFDFVFLVYFNMIWTKVIYTSVKKRFIPSGYSEVWRVHFYILYNFLVYFLNLFYFLFVKPLHDRIQ